MIAPRAARLAFILAPFLSSAVGAKTLTVGQGQQFAAPSQAIAAAQDGDTIAIGPGSYFDCAIVHQNRLVIEGTGEGAVMTDRSCQDKAILVIQADGVTIRNLTLARARVPDGNGAGIRLEAPNLLVQRVTFDNDQVGVLGSSPGGTIQIENSRFVDGGTSGDRALGAVMSPAAALLRIANSTFQNVNGSQVWTAAAQTELLGNTIATGVAPRAPIWATAGNLVMTDNTLTIGPNAPPQDAAVVLFDAATATLRHNRLENRSGARLALLLDWSTGHPTLDGNTIAPGDTLSSTAGVWRHRVSSSLHGAKDELRGIAGQAKRSITAHLR